MTVQPILVLAVTAAVFGVIVLLGFILPPPDPIAQLTRTYLQLAHLPRRQARAQLAERVEALSRRFPGETYQWYLEWLVTDLKRAKR